MDIHHIAESDLDVSLASVRNVAGASIEWRGVEYAWMKTYPKENSQEAQNHCQDLLVHNRASLVIAHDNGNLTVWQGPTGSASSSTLNKIDGRELPAPVPQSEVVPQQPTVTIKYRGTELIKPVVFSDDEHERQHKSQRNYRGQKY